MYYQVVLLSPVQQSESLTHYVHFLKRFPSPIGHHRVLSSLCCNSRSFLSILYTAVCVWGEGNGSPLQYPHLEDPVDRGAWWAAVHGVAQSQTTLKRLSSSVYMSIPISQFIPPLTLVTVKFVFCICDSLCFVRKFICTLLLKIPP